MNDFSLPKQGAPDLPTPPTPPKQEANLSPEEAAGRAQLKLGLRQIGIGLICMASASGLGLIMRYGGMMIPMADMWIGNIARIVAVGFFISGLLQLTAVPERFEVKGLALMVLGGVVPRPALVLLSTFAFRFGFFNADMALVWIVVGLVDAAAYGAMAYMLWRIDARHSGAAQDFAKPPPLALAALVAAGLSGLFGILRSIDLMPHTLFALMPLVFVAMYVTLFIYTLMLRNRL